MSSGFILLYDDDTKIIESFKGLFDELKTKLKLQSYSNIAEFEARIQDNNLMSQTKCVICDLAKNIAEMNSHKFEVVTILKKTHNAYRIPIFIHSANLVYFDDFKDEGTVFKISKSGAAIKTICNKITLMDETGFLDVFCPGGNIEVAFMTQLHSAFIEQFKNNEIEEIINCIKDSTEGDCGTRVHQVFMRIALRALMHNITAAAENKTGAIKEKELNGIEHYYRRKSAYTVWTGDVFRKKDGTETLVVITPRCDINTPRGEQLLVCKILPVQNFTDLDQLQKAIRDNPSSPCGGYRHRFLTKTPFYEGGKIDFATHYSIDKNSLLSNYLRIITLSDELTNDVVRKFCSYISRSGVSETEINEAVQYCNFLSKANPQTPATPN